VNKFVYVNPFSVKIKICGDITVIGAILDRGQKSDRKQYGVDLMKAQFEECKM
jgi:hypothetical protein